MGGSLVGMEPLLSLQTSIGEAFEVNWATCQQLVFVVESSWRTRAASLIQRRLKPHSTGYPNVLAARWKERG
jgi:hypothetical protein